MIESDTYFPFTVAICDASFMFAHTVSIWEVPKWNVQYSISAPWQRNKFH